jgi:hypothetical protein
MDQVKQFISWIGGAVAGLSILFYAAGYLVYRAHINMLGLSGVVDYPHEQLLYEGAKFYFTVVSYLLKSFFVIGIALLLVVITAMLFRQIGWIDRAITTGTTWTRSRMAHWNARRPALLRAFLLAMLGVLFVLHTDRFFYPLQDLYGGIEHLLYVPSSANAPARCAIPAAGHEADEMAIAVTTWLRQGEICRSQLLGEFRRLLAGYLLLLVGGYFALRHRTFSNTLVYRVGTATLVVYGVLYTLLLPVAFGVLVRSPVYPVIAIKPGPRPALHLLHRHERTLLVWDAAARKAIWLAGESAGAEFEVYGQANLFVPVKGATAP